MGWTRISGRTLFENDWMELRNDHVINPGGGENQYGYVHFKTVAIAVLPIDAQGNTWLVGQSRYTLGQYSWELPMGGVPHAEDPLAGAKRELKEETGLTAASWTEVMRLHTSNSITDELAIVYIARDLTAGETEHEQTEDITVKVVPLSEAVRMVQDGEITDAVSAATLLRYALEFQGS